MAGACLETGEGLVAPVERGPDAVQAAVERQLWKEVMVGQIVGVAGVGLGPLRLARRQVFEAIGEVFAQLGKKADGSIVVLELAEEKRLRQKTDAFGADDRTVFEPLAKCLFAGIGARVDDTLRALVGIDRVAGQQAVFFEFLQGRVDLRQLRAPEIAERAVEFFLDVVSAVRTAHHAEQDVAQAQASSPNLRR